MEPTIFSVLLVNVQVLLNLLVLNSGYSLTAFAETVCREFEFLDATGKPRVSSCIKALRKVEAREPGLKLPESRRITRLPRQNKFLSGGLPCLENLPADANCIQNLSLQMVETKEELILWNTIMKDHPKGLGPFIGHQIRYIITSEYGPLGGFIFSSSFRDIEVREKFIGWTYAEKEQNRIHTSCMNRFWLRPEIKCNGLANAALNLAVEAFPKDFFAKFNIKQFVLETYSDPKDFSGHCFEEAGWKYLGYTKGKGRYDQKKVSETITCKKVFIYPLVNDFREQMQLECSKSSILTIDESLEGDWIQREFFNSSLDKRLAQSLVNLARAKNNDLGSHVSNIFQSDKSATNRAYYFLNYKNKDAVNMFSILSRHTENTIKRIRSQSVVYVIQDGCIFNYNNLIHTEGLGAISKKKGGAVSKGLHEHSSLAVTIEGYPLGFIAVSCFAPVLRTEKEKLWRELIPQEEKLTQLWLDHYIILSRVAELAPNTKIICLCDRECDFYNFFKLAKKLHLTHPNLQYMLRVEYNRILTNKKKLFQTLGELEPTESFTLNVPALSSRSLDDKGRPKRIAEVEIRSATLQIKAPSNTKQKGYVETNFLYLREKNPPKGQDRLEWFLATGCPIDTSENRLFCAKIYPTRWKIEEIHKTIKSSACNAEDLRHRSADAIMNSLAIDMILAWHVYLLVSYSKSDPALDPSKVFTLNEIHVL